MAILSRLSRYQDTGLLLLRLGIGAMMMYHGVPKLTGGTEMWGKVGGTMANYGIPGPAVFWGFMAAFAEGIGGLLFLIGFIFRPACFLLLITMIVAAATHFHMGDGMAKAGHPIELAILFLAMFIIGPGRYSVDKR